MSGEENQSAEPLLSVRGEAVIEVEPEIARIAITVSARDPDRAKVLRQLNDRARSIDAILHGFDDTIDKIETTAIRVSPQLKSRKPQERISGYVATVRHTITVSEFTRLGELFAQLADQDVTEISGPWWALRPDSPVHRSARIDATHDALRRARDYADAVGSHVTELVELADAQLLSGLRGPMQPMVMAAASPLRAGATAPEELTFDIVPAKQVVHASVDARFRITRPDIDKVDR